MKKRFLKDLLAGFSVLVSAMGFGGMLDAEMGFNGEVRLGTKGVKLEFTIHRQGWSGISHGLNPGFTFPDPQTRTAAFALRDGERKIGHGTATLLPVAPARALYVVNATSDCDQKPEAVVLSLTLPCSAYAGGTWTDASGQKRTLPRKYDKMALFNAPVSAMTFAAADRTEPFTLTFPKPTQVMLQDDRLWGPTFTLRISPDAAKTFNRGAQRSFVWFISAPDGVDAQIVRPVVIERGEDWIALDYCKNIEPGSALDFSGMGLQDAPAGKYGWLKNVGGHFEFEGRPGVPQRFYGVNLCFSANFPSEALADELVTRLVRLGYNTLRIHHFDGEHGVTKGSKDGLTINREWMKRLDYLLCRAMEKGLYVTADLYTTRVVRWREIGIDRDGTLTRQVYKNMIGVHAPAFENWKMFTRNFLTHVNAYTGRRYLDEPGLPMISLINEGNLSWCWDEIRHEAPMKEAWKNWLRKKRAADPSYAKEVPEDAAQVVCWDNAVFNRFMADVEEDLFRRQRAFLETLGVKALLTSQNCGRHYPAMMAVRERCYDYVDDHFYVDHPHFIVSPWMLPSKCPNKNPVFSNHLAPVACAYTRMPSKPFCVTEWNFSGPGMFRGVGGIMTGAMGALQNWDGLWRFAYAHQDVKLRDRSGYPEYFDMGADPLGQASDRASICLFLRGDMAPLTDRLALTVTPKAFEPVNGKAPDVVPNWLDAAWQTQVSTAVAPPPAGVKAFDLAETEGLAKAPVELAPNPSFTLDRERGSVRIETARTVGGFTPEGSLRVGPIAFDVGNVPATVWVSTLDGRPVRTSRRLLLTHLTDVQASGNVYADREKTTLLKWGTYPPLVRNGAATVSLALAEPHAYEVWALATTGRRVARLPVAVRDGRLEVTVSVKGPEGARMLYEVVHRDAASGRGR